MKIVADKLCDIAREKGVSRADRDLYCRSAFNRYYYDCFLTTRGLCGRVDATWLRVSHSDLPKILRGKLRRKVKNAFSEQQKAGMLSHGKCESKKSSLVSNSQMLASLLTEAYAKRVVADYEPEQKVIFENGSARLGETKLSTASGWPNKARLYSQKILRLLEEAGF